MCKSKHHDWMGSAFTASSSVGGARFSTIAWPAGASAIPCGHHLGGPGARVAEVLLRQFATFLIFLIARRSFKGLRQSRVATKVVTEQIGDLVQEPQRRSGVLPGAVAPVVAHSARDHLLSENLGLGSAHFRETGICCCPLNPHPAEQVVAGSDQVTLLRRNPVLPRTDALRKRTTNSRFETLFILGAVGRRNKHRTAFTDRDLNRHDIPGAVLGEHDRAWDVPEIGAEPTTEPAAAPEVFLKWVAWLAHLEGSTTRLRELRDRTGKSATRGGQRAVILDVGPEPGVRIERVLLVGTPPSSYWYLSQWVDPSARRADLGWKNGVSSVARFASSTRSSSDQPGGLSLTEVPAS